MQLIHDEAVALDTFWANLHQPTMDALELLRVFLTVEITRPRKWDLEKVRRESTAVNDKLTSTACAVCRNVDRPREWHHIITVGHGGSASPRNRIAICFLCHERLHPGIHRDLSGWVSIGEVAERVARRQYGRRYRKEEERRQQHDDGEEDYHS